MILRKTVKIYNNILLKLNKIYIISVINFTLIDNCKRYNSENSKKNVEKVNKRAKGKFFFIYY